MPELPPRPPFALRARLLSPLADGRLLHEPDGLLEVDRNGVLARVGAWVGGAQAPASVLDLRPMVVMPGLVDLHLHLPQLPNAGLGGGLDLLTWLERHIFPLERAFDRDRAEIEAPAAFRAMAAAGTTTAVAYAALWPDSTDAAFAAAESHGIRAVIGKVMMDRGSYDSDIQQHQILDTSLAQSDALAKRWHGRDAGRLQYAFTPRFAVSCTAEMLRESAALARAHGAYWQTHLAEDAAELAQVATLFPESSDYLDVYDRADALGPRSILAHAVHLSGREVDRLVESDSRVAHCPASNLFLASGMMPLAAYRAPGMAIGLGSDVAAGPELSLFSVMRAGALTQRAIASHTPQSDGILDPPDWLRMASLGGARVLGLEGDIGSLEVGKEADLIAVDPRLTTPVAGQDTPDDPADLASRLIFRPHPEMVRAAWVRGRLLEGPPGVDGIG
jgi:guanine deaminase